MTTSPRRVAIIQARMSSSRYPGKVLADLAGMPMILFMVQRVRRSRHLDQVVVATSTDASDDRLADVLAVHNVECFRGDLVDVLDRFTRAARAARADHVVRLTGDCPLMDPDLIDRGLSELARGDADYVSNVAPPTYPDGLDVECFTRNALESAWREARLASEREHVTPFLRNGGAGTRVRNWAAVADLSALRWTVDHPDDLQHVAALVAASSQSLDVGAVRSFDRFDLLRVIETQAIGPSAEHSRNEGYMKSLSADS